MEKGQNTKKMTRVAMGVHQVRADTPLSKYDCVRPGCGYQSYFLVVHTALAVLTEILSIPVFRGLFDKAVHRVREQRSHDLQSRRPPPHVKGYQASACQSIQY